MSLITSQPGKGLWVLFAVLINLVRFPWLFIYYLPRFTRPNPRWTWRQTIRVQIIRTAIYHMATVNMKTPLSLLPQAESDRWAVAQPASETTYTGPANLDPEVRPKPLGATWYPAAAKVSKPSGPVILHFHGGAFMIGKGRTRDLGFLAKTLLANTAATAVFAPQYRLAGNPGGRFPAALQDAITAYAHLIREEGIPADKIILSGDSAGGNMVLALLRYLTEHGESAGLENPLCAWLWSPWVSPGRSRNADNFNQSPNKGLDYICADFGAWGALAYHPQPATGADLSHPYIDFYNNVFPTRVPIFVSTGECEVLLHDDVKLSEDLAKVPGNRVRLQVEELVVHDTILIANRLGFHAEAVRMAKRANDFLQSVLSGSAI